MRNYHPLTCFMFFLMVIIITMFTLNPIIIALSYICAVGLCFTIIDTKKMVKSLCCSIILMMIIALTNPLFVHKGATELFFLNNYRITLESLIYGIVMSIMISAIFYWFKAYNIIITSDKFIYLFGKITPKISLMISMSLAFIPKLKRQYHEILDSQKALGIYLGDSVADRLKSGFRILTILFSWGIESGVETANSMEARGYGLRGRTSYSIYHFATKDGVVLGAIVALFVGIAVMIGLGYGDFGYYPRLSVVGVSAGEIALYIMSLVLFTAGVFLEIKESFVWRLLQSKI